MPEDEDSAFKYLPARAEAVEPKIAELMGEKPVK